MEIFTKKLVELFNFLCLFFKTMDKDLIVQMVLLLITIVVAIYLFKFVLKYQKLEYLNRIEKRKDKKIDDLINLVTSVSPEELAKALELNKFKTINIYRNKNLNLYNHSVLLQATEEYLKQRGYANYMSKEDQQIARDWLNPVLVIYPKGRKFFYHNDQSESRENSV